MRNLTHNLNRNPTRYTTRMLGGLRRPPQPDYLGIACRAFEKVYEIDRRLQPYIQEQIRLQKQRAWDAQIDAALDRVYGPETKQPDAGPQ